MSPYHRNKRSVALDMKTDAGQHVMRRLIAGSDVLITDYPHPVRDEEMLTRLLDALGKIELLVDPRFPNLETMFGGCPRRVR